LPTGYCAVAFLNHLTGAGTRGFLAYRVEQTQALRPGIRAIPWHLAW
jgi:hypothetical protein